MTKYIYFFIEHRKNKMFIKAGFHMFVGIKALE